MHSIKILKKKIMTDLLGNELNIGDKVVYAICNRDTKDLDYGIVTKISEKLCFCK